MFRNFQQYEQFLFIRETQISGVLRTEICKSNNPDQVGGYNTPSLGAKFWSPEYSGPWGAYPRLPLIHPIGYKKYLNPHNSPEKHNSPRIQQ
jgi:hypothetical protein